MIVMQEKEMRSMVGQVLTTSAILGYLAIAAGAAAIFKIITSSRGRVSIPGVNISWG